MLYSKFYIPNSKFHLEGRYRLGACSNGGTPVPFSNTEVKPVSSDGTWTQPGPGRVTQRQDNDVLRKKHPERSGCFLFSYE